MYTAKAKILRWGPNTTYILLTRVGVCIGGNANLRFGVGGNTNFSVFRYQHVCVPNAKLWRWVSEPTQGPNANGFALQWNIGLKPHPVDKKHNIFRTASVEVHWCTSGHT